MREIKFRIWDKVSKTMFHPMTLEKLMEGWGTSGMDLVFMQYTGLRDGKRTTEYPEGQEIYEGDICEDARGFRFVVVWDDNARFLGRGIGVWKEYIRYVGQEKPAVEVIGNVWEDSDLLK